MKSLTYISLILLVMVSCKKPEDRTCWKGHGNQTSVEFPLDSIHSFYLGKKIKYRIYEDNERKVVIRGGENMIKQIELDYSDHKLTINNLNKCHFLRDHERKIEVDIHYPVYDTLYLTASDSIIFKDTIKSPVLFVEMEEAGGTMLLNVDNVKTEIVVSIGTADYILGGHASSALLKIQDKGYADASNFTSDNLFAYQNSTSDLYLNLHGAIATVWIAGTGDVYYSGTPDSLSLQGVGSGKLIEN